MRTEAVVILVFAVVFSGDAPRTLIARARALESAAQRNLDTVETGRQLFMNRCASCHGLDAKGVTAPSLQNIWGTGATDPQVFRIIRGGVQGTEMPSFVGSDDEIRAILVYLHSLPMEPDATRPANA